MSNLLVIDFDFFFRNPMEAGDTSDQAFWLYDWGHAENRFYIEGNIVWPSRAYGFIKEGLNLPVVDVPDGFWDRFTVTDDTPLFVADSNAYAGLLYDQNGDPFHDVYLYDAHHDLYKFKTRKQVQDWHETGQDITCENWMYKHLMRGSQLHWRYPQWLASGQDSADNVPPWVGLDARMDDGKPLPVEIDTIFLCRSGAWVPPWCDEQFEEFMNSAPVCEIDQLDDVNLKREGWQEQVEAIRSAWSESERKVAL